MKKLIRLSPLLFAASLHAGTMNCAPNDLSLCRPCPNGQAIYCKKVPHEKVSFCDCKPVKPKKEHAAPHVKTADK